MSRLMNADHKHLGTEPKDMSEYTEKDVQNMYRWYGYFHNAKNAKEWILKYLELTKEQSASIKKVHEHYIPNTLGWIARCIYKGYKPSDKHKKYIQDKLAELVKLGNKVSIEKEDDKPKENVRSIQDFIMDQVWEMYGDIQIAIDNWDTEKFDTATWLAEKKPSTQHMSKLKAQLQKEIDEVADAIDNWDNFPEGDNPFSWGNKNTIKKFLKFKNEIMNAFNVYTDANKTVRKARKKKPVSVEKKIAKLKYKEIDTELGIASVNPAEIINSRECWVYNIKTKKLTVYRSDIGLEVKGTTIIGFDETKSEEKSVRTNAINIIKELPKTRKNSLKNIMSELTTKFSTKINGRLNEESVILRCIK